MSWYSMKTGRIPSVFCAEAVWMYVLNTSFRLQFVLVNDILIRILFPLVHK